MVASGQGGNGSAFINARPQAQNSTYDRARGSGWSPVTSECLSQRDSVLRGHELGSKSRLPANWTLAAVSDGEDTKTSEKFGSSPGAGSQMIGGARLNRE